MKTGIANGQQNATLCWGGARGGAAQRALSPLSNAITLTMKIREFVVGFSFILACVSLAQAKHYPFEGKWDCDVSIFTFTDLTYNNGSQTLTYKTVKRQGTSYLITFADGYRIGLFGIKRNSMTWMSGSSTDDVFRCRRIE
jgi:hypothetical protein